MKNTAIILAWPREIDMYQQLIYSKNFDIIINDFNSIEKGRNQSNILLKKILRFKDVKYKLLSKIYKKKKYNVIISTGEVSAKKISLYSILRYIYSRTIGFFLEISNISKLLELIFNRPFTADGLNSSIGLSWFPEKELGKKSIKFPDGIDLNKKNYPYNVYKNSFDLFLSYSDFEINLIKKKFKNKICKKISYFRYDFLNTKKKKYKKKIISEFSLNKNKPILVWFPTHIDLNNVEDTNITFWYDKILLLKKNYNLIIRPHPKTLIRNSLLIDKLKRLAFIIDTKIERPIFDLIKSADLVLADYGGIVFDAIYLKKKIILLNLPKNSIFVKKLKQNKALDLDARSKIINIENSINNNKLQKVVFNVLKCQNKNSVLNNKMFFYGKTKPINFRRFISFLKNYEKQ
jgi:hypothetical protein